MAHVNTIFAQFVKLVPRHEFESLANTYHSGRKFRKVSRWSQFMAMTFAQLSGRVSLRDVVSNLSAQSHRLYHLGCRILSRSTLARLNEEKPYELYEALFGKLLTRCQNTAPGHGFRFNNKLISIDSSTIDLCLNMFPWAKFRTTKGAIKLHVGLDHDGLMPSFLKVSDGKKTDIDIARSLSFPKESIVVVDRGYNDYSWFKQLNSKGVYFVTRLKSNADYRIIDRRPVDKSQGLLCDQTIKFTGYYAKQNCDIALRRVHYRDSETGIDYDFLTNNFKLSARTIAAIYKQRWQIELFFKWIKQNLKIKSFIGTSKNAVLTQIWIAMCAYLMLVYLKFCSKLTKSLQEIIRLLQVNLFEKRDLMALLRGDPPENNQVCKNQGILF